MVEVNWPQWIVLRCEPKTDTDGNIRGERREGGKTLDWRGGNFPREKP